MIRLTKENLKEAIDIINNVIDNWQTPDSPEAFCLAMKRLSDLQKDIETLMRNQKNWE